MNSGVLQNARFPAESCPPAAGGTSIFAFPEPAPFSTHSELTLSPCSPFVLIPGVTQVGTFLECFQVKCLIFLVAFSPTWGSPPVFEHTRLPVPSRPSHCAPTPVMWPCGIWQSGWHWEVAQSHTPLVFPVAWATCFLFPLLTHEGSYFKQTLPASVPLLRDKTEKSEEKAG